MAEEFMGDEIFTLTDEEGNESEFELIASQETVLTEDFRQNGHQVIQR